MALRFTVSQDQLKNFHACVDQRSVREPEIGCLAAVSSSITIGMFPNLAVEKSE